MPTGRVTISSLRASSLLMINAASDSALAQALDALNLGTYFSVAAVPGSTAPALFDDGGPRSDRSPIVAYNQGAKIPATAAGYTQAVTTPAGVTGLNCANRSIAPLIFLNGGQSNMVGQGLLADLPGGFPVLPNQITLFGNDYLFHTPATEPVDVNTNQVDTVSSDVAFVGPALAFANAVTQARANQLVLVPCARGGTTTTDWQPGTNHYDRSTLYGSMLFRAVTIQTAMRAPIAGLLWYQGENNALDAAGAAVYQAETQNIWTQLRADLGLPDLPIFFVQLPLTAASAHPNWSDVRTAQAALNIPASKQFMTSAPNGPWISVADLHLTTSAQLVLGANLGASYLANY